MEILFYLFVVFYIFSYKLPNCVFQKNQKSYE